MFASAPIKVATSANCGKWLQLKPSLSCLNGRNIFSLHRGQKFVSYQCFKHTACAKASMTLPTGVVADSTPVLGTKPLSSERKEAAWS